MHIKHLLFVAIILIGFCSLPAFAGPAKFVGVNDCKKCHKKPKGKSAYDVWKKSKHAKAYHLLGSEKAKKKAVEVGLKTDPQKSKECLVCHTAGYGAPKKLLGKKYKIEDGVQCENCHGAGGNYKKKKLMKKIYKERKKGGNTLALKYGLDRGTKDTCVKQCHQPERIIDGVTYVNPSYQEFDFEKRVKEIAHPVIKKKKKKKKK